MEDLGNRHTEIRDLSIQANVIIKEEGGKNDLIARIKATAYFRPTWADIDSLLDPALFVGRSVEIVKRFNVGRVVFWMVNWIPTGAILGRVRMLS